jgi:hypothetical protein
MISATMQPLVQGKGRAVGSEPFISHACSKEFDA